MNSYYSTRICVLALFKIMKGTMCVKLIFIVDRLLKTRYYRRNFKLKTNLFNIIMRTCIFFFLSNRYHPAPGISAYINEPIKAYEILKPKLVKLTSKLTVEQKKRTPIYLAATAGMRLKL